LDKFTNRLPHKYELIPVFAAIVFPVYSWSLLELFNILPSWLNYLQPFELTITILYVLAFGLVESAMILLALISLAVITPSRFFKDQFIPQGSLLAWLYLLWNIIINKNLNLFEPMGLREFAMYSLGFILIVVLVSTLLCYLLIYRIKLANRAIQSISEKMTVFLYIYIPLSIIGLSVVIFRNLFG